MYQKLKDSLIPAITIITNRNSWYLVITFFLSYCLASITLFNEFAVLHPDQFNVVSIQWPIIIACLLGLLISSQMSFKFLGKVSFLYLFFLSSSYFIEMTLRLNDPDFKWKSFNGFWQNNYLIWLCLVLCVSLFFRFLTSKIKQVSKLSIADKKTFEIPVLAQLLTALYLSSHQFLNRLLENNFYSVKTGDFFEVRSHIFLYALYFFLLMLPVCYFFFKAISDIYKNKASLSLAISSSIILATLMNYGIQAAVTEKGRHYDFLIAPGATSYQIIIFASIFLIIYAIVNRYVLATLLITFSGSVIVLINHFKYTARYEPIVFSDLMWIKDIAFFKDYISLTSITIAFQR